MDVEMVQPHEGALARGRRRRRLAPARGGPGAPARGRRLAAGERRRAPRRGAPAGRDLGEARGSLITVLLPAVSHAGDHSGERSARTVDREGKKP